MQLPNPLRGAQPENLEEGRFWLGFTLFGGLMPLYGGAFFLLLFSSEISFEAFIDHGEFAIYSAGLLATSLLVVVREYKAPFPERATWGLITGVLLVLAVLVFAVAAAADAAPDVAKDVNRGLLRVSSLVIYGLALATTFVLTVKREILTVNVEAIRAKRMGRLEDVYDSTGG